MNIIYYIQVNLICIILLLLFRGQLAFKYKQMSTENRIFTLLIWTTIILCISDMIAGICRGKIFSGARAIIEISNLIFYEALAVGCFLWMIYVFIKLNVIKRLDKKVIIWAIPLLIFTVVGISNPLTHFLFNIDENNLYVRNTGIYFHWAVTWFYLITATVRTAIAVSFEKNKQIKKGLMSLIYFIIPPFIAAIIQMLFYGVTSSQVGVTISIVVVSLLEIKNQVLTDALTGLNNRHGFNKYLENHIMRHVDDTVSFTMIDLNDFKKLNDQYGHIVGDLALKDVADTLRCVCDRTHLKRFLCRYGGDEFIIVGINSDKRDLIRLQEIIGEEFEKKNTANRKINRPYTLGASTGFATGKCHDLRDVDELLHMADEVMYKEKARLKSRAGLKG